MSTRKFWGGWILVPALTAAVALWVYFKDAGTNASPGQRVGTVVFVGLVILLMRPLLAGAWRVVARHGRGRMAHRYDRDPLSRIGAAKAAPSIDLNAYRAGNLREVLRDRHGRRWRDAERWVLVAGDEPIVDRLAPGLADAGYVVAGGIVLLYAKQTANTLDTGWLEQIRRLRRHRPVDAIVAVARNRSATTNPFDTDVLARQLARHARALRWAAPAYLLNVTDFGSETSRPDESIGLTWSSARIDADAIDASLQDLTRALADAGVARLSHDASDRYPAELSRHIARFRSPLSGLVLQTAQARVWRQAVHGLLFVPLFKVRKLAPPASAEASDHDPAAGYQHRALWQTVAEHGGTIRGRRVGFSPSRTAAWIATGLIGCWIAGTVVSGFANHATLRNAGDTLAALTAEQNPTRAMTMLDRLDRQIDTLDVRRRDGAPWLSRFGLNRDGALLDALWPGYANAASRILVAPIRQTLEERLHRLALLSDAEIASGGSAEVQAAYDTLKAYLMLARPERAAAAFLAPRLAATAVPARPASSQLSSGAWEDLRRHTIAFLADHLDVAMLPAVAPDPGLVAATRQTIIGVRGIQNSTDAVYRQILDDAKAKYPPVSLATLLGDTTSQGLFNATATVPGVFTRAAWDERIAKAIDDAGRQHDVAADWVLSDTQAAQAEPSTLKAQLRQRYFDDYTRAWAVFLNGLRWQPADTLSATADQLTLLGDPQRSPFVALMNAIVYQAGTGANAQSLADSLIGKAQRLVGASEKHPSQPALAPLAAAFGPILRLMGSDLVSGAPANGTAAARLAAMGDLSVARYLERVNAMRLKVSQIASAADPDAMARQAAQSVLQGRTSELAESREYAGRLAASLGEQWSGLGELLRAPFDQSWRMVVQPAASSLNDLWRTAIVAEWNRALGGRYPFADSDNDASLPEMARFMRPDSGVIAQFVTTQLAGVVERQGDRWVASQGAGHGTLTIDPGFLSRLNRLMRVATVLFPSGDAQVRYELQAVPTPGVTDMRFVLSGRELHYFNQKLAWTPFEWPGQALENLSHIEWQTERSGLRTALDTQGRFGLIRLMERAKVSQQDGARYLLSWAPDTSQGTALRVQLRSEAGAGPLDVLQLRHFTLPARIFVTGAAKVGPTLSTIDPLPLPASMAAAKHPEIPLPRASLRAFE